MSLWDKIRPKVKQLFVSKGIFECELHLAGCWIHNALSFAHRHKRKWYLDKKELLGDFNQIVLACVPCHEKIEDDKEATEKHFVRLRDNREELEYV